MTSFSVLGYSSLLPVSDCAQDNDLDACLLGVLVGRPRNIPGVLRHGVGSRIPKEDKNRGLRSQAILHTRWAKYGSLDCLWLYVCLCVCHSQRQKCLFFAWGAPRGTLHLVPRLFDNNGNRTKARGQRKTPLHNAGACLLLPLIREIPRATGHGGKVVLRSEKHLSWLLNYSNSVERSKADNQSVLSGLLRRKNIKR